jgi:hypothetical protein
LFTADRIRRPRYLTVKLAISRPLPRNPEKDRLFVGLMVLDVRSL